MLTSVLLNVTIVVRFDIGMLLCGDFEYVTCEVVS